MPDINKPNENRRNSMRVKLAIDMCITEQKHEGDDEERIHCFSTKTIDVSATGACITHNGALKAGDTIELRSKNCLTYSQCLTCESTYFMSNKVELTPIWAEVVWATARRAGIRYLGLSARNENVLGKLIWDEHLKSVRNERDKGVRT